MNRLWNTVGLAALGFFLSIATPLSQVAVQQPVDIVEFTPDRWDLQNATVVDHLGRKALMGTAFLKDVEFDDGVIECDVAMKAGVRAYPGVLFRVQSARDYERVYLRPHRAPLYDDAVQYVPTFNGVDSWQLYNGPGKTTAAAIPTERWLHFRLEVLGTQARVYLDNSPEPVLVVGDLGRGKSSGGLGLTTAADGTAFFSNFSYRRDASLRFPPAPAIHTPPGIVTEWEVSTPFKRRQLDFDRYPDANVLGAAGWAKTTARRDGVLDISRVHGRLGVEPDGILARTTIRAEQEGPKKYWFGYSDEASIFVNGRLVFSGNSAYRSRDTSFLGIVGPFDSVSLPLRKGDNEVLFAIGEVSGGWGLMLQDATAVGTARGVEQMWTTGSDFLVPESAAYDPGTNAFYVSNYDAYNPSRGEPRQFISKVSPNGHVQALKWISGLSNPSGLAVRDGKLYVVERAGIAEIDIASASITSRIPIPGAAFPNDIAVAENGEIYVSDSRKNSIYKLAGGKVEEWLNGSQVAAPNGVLVLQAKLIVGTNGDGCLKAVDLETKTVEILANLGVGLIDGIAADGEGGLLVSHNEGRILRIAADGQMTTVLDTTAIRVNAADIAYAADLKTLVIPTFTGGRVVAYRLGPPDDEKVWSAFAAWARTQPPGNSFQGYRAVLEKEGLPPQEIQRRVSVIQRFASERWEGVEFIYDRIFSQPLTGDPAKDGFTSAPSVFLAEATRALKPGTALDVGAGQGRNAVYLATKGWVVTAIDVSGAGLAATRANAEKAGVKVATVKTTYDAFDFGTGKWDLIAMILSWAPVEDPAFVARLVASLHPGGAVVFEHVIQRVENPFPPNVHALGSGELRTYFGGLRIERYEEVTALGDWGGPPSRLVRMVARKTDDDGRERSKRCTVCN